MDLIGHPSATPTAVPVSDQPTILSAPLVRLVSGYPAKPKDALMAGLLAETRMYEIA